MATIKASITIHRPLEEVFSFVSNPENRPQWQSGVLEVKPLSQGSEAPGVGKVYRIVFELLGQRIDESWEITEFTPERYWSRSITGLPTSWRKITGTRDRVAQ